MGATDGRRGEIYGNLAAWKPRLLRVVMEKERPSSHMPRAARPQFPGLEVGEARTGRPILRKKGSRLTPHLWPKLQVEPWVGADAEFKRAAQNDVARRQKFGAR